MYLLRVRFTDRRACLPSMQADMSTIVGRHIRRAVDDTPWAAATAGWTVGKIDAYAKAKGLHIASFTEHRGDYLIRYEDKEGERLNALEDDLLRLSRSKGYPKAKAPKAQRLPEPKAEYSPDGHLLVGHPAYGNHSLEQAPPQGALDIDALPMPHEAGHADAWAKHVEARHALSPDVYALDKGTPLAPDVKYHYE